MENIIKAKEEGRERRRRGKREAYAKFELAT